MTALRRLFALVAALVLALGFVVPATGYAPTVRAAVGTVIMSFALAAAGVYCMQFLRTRRTRDLLLYGGLLLLGLIELFTCTLPAVMDIGSSHQLAAAALLGKLSVAAVLAAAASVPRRRLLAGVRRPVTITVAAFAGVAGAELLAHLYNFRLPSLAPNWVAPNAALSLLAAVLVLAAALRREFATRAQIATAAAIAERRRVARDLHDGLAQDLAFIAAHGAQMSTELGRDHPVAVAARRALMVSRGTIGELSDPAGVTALEALEAVAHELRARFDINITVFGELDHEPAPYDREQLSRIAREAIANAARHGRAKHVIVALRYTADRVTLRVTDDGSSIPPEARDGFGIGAMRDRASGLGGRLTVRPAGKRGTELEVVVPQMSAATS